MDKMSKFRRRPKPPAIETRVERSSSDTVESVPSPAAPPQVPAASVTAPSPKPAAGGAAAAAAPLLSRHNSSSASSVKAAEGTLRPPSRKSAFRGLRLRASNKRMRDMSPASSISRPSSPQIPQTSAMAKDGPKAQKRDPSTQRSVSEYESAMEELPDADPGPRMPSFLDLSRQVIDGKLTELNWDERIRTVAGQRTDNSAQSRWSTFKQTDGEERGFMDRYLNIRPWNHNRVKLQVPEGQFDYVNASIVTLESPSDSSRPPLRYIAMQGPTEPSIPYVWRMISEQVEQPIVIVQLTSMVEAGLLKCNQYFPDGEETTPWTLNEQNIWGDDWNATLTYGSMEPIADGAIEKRKLLLHVEGEEEPRLVWHFLYKRWPDFGVPLLDDLDSFFELMRISREHSSPKGPRVIHCSAGIGRTGTFISLEHLIRELDVGALYDPPPSDKSKSQRNQKQDLIYDTVDSLRQQRRGMVQGEIQYRFIYQVLRKLWQDRYGAPVADGDTDMVDGGVELARNGTATDPFLDKKSGKNATNDEDNTNSARKLDDTDEDEEESHGNDDVEDDEDEDGGAAVPGPNASATRG